MSALGSKVEFAVSSLPRFLIQLHLIFLDTLMFLKP